MERYLPAFSLLKWFLSFEITVVWTEIHFTRQLASCRGCRGHSRLSACAWQPQQHMLGEGCSPHPFSSPIPGSPETVAHVCMLCSWARRGSTCKAWPFCTPFSLASWSNTWERLSAGLLPGVYRISHHQQHSSTAKLTPGFLLGHSQQTAHPSDRLLKDNKITRSHGTGQSVVCPSPTGQLVAYTQPETIWQQEKLHHREQLLLSQANRLWDPIYKFYCLCFQTT